MLPGMLLSSLILVLSGCDGGEVPINPFEKEPPPETSFMVFDGPAPSNLLFVSIDTLRRDHLDRYGVLGMTPFIDNLMETGFPLDAHQACSNWTYAGILCALSGQNNVPFGFVPRLSKTYRVELPDDTPMLPNWLREIGFGSALVSSNGYLSNKWNTAQGFDEVVYPGFEPAETMFDLGMEEIDKLRAAYERWFVHIHLRDLHAPYDPPAEYLTELEGLPEINYDLSNWDSHYRMAGMFLTLDEDERDLIEQHLRIRYEGALRYTDDMIQYLWSELDRRHVLEDTLIVFWTDHGEQFWEHQRQSHAWSLHYGENDAVAFFWANDLQPGKWTGPTVQEDIVPTVFEILGIPQREEFTGLPVGAAADDRVMFFTSDGRIGPEQAVQQSGNILDYYWSGDRTFYRRSVDPQEENEVYDPEDPDVIALWEHLAPYVEETMPLLPEKTPEEFGL